MYINIKCTPTEEHICNESMRETLLLNGVEPWLPWLFYPLLESTSSRGICTGPLFFSFFLFFFSVHWVKRCLFLASHDRLPQHTKEPKLTRYPPSLQPGDIRAHYVNKTTGCCFQTQLLELESLMLLFPEREPDFRNERIKDDRKRESPSILMSLDQSVKIQPEIQSTEFQL